MLLLADSLTGTHSVSSSRKKVRAQFVCFRFKSDRSCDKHEVFSPPIFFATLQYTCRGHSEVDIRLKPIV